MVVVEEKNFLCGVVEGFYGRPWTCEQRRELFSRMQRSTMNTYIYAPKDDIKHRALWRQLYSSEEESKLKVLIDAANKEGVTFVYAISPGLDITFSNNADVSALKRKMKQVGKLGCKAFALLFDDINPTLKPSDSVVYSSSAAAQASLTNELYKHMKQPKFLFCPTEYCKTRAIPTVKKSEYLNTLGKELIQDIDIMWTGDKVIPELITKDSVKELGEVLNRKPVIWDNIHANDYDQRRVFLGGYHGRPVELYPFLNGILTNPNCEFEANYIAIHTLGSWCRIASSIQSSSSFDVPMVDLSEDVCVSPPVSPPPTTEGDCEMPVDLLPSLTAADVTAIISDYDYKEAVKLALQDWLQEFNLNKKAPLKSYSKRNLKTAVVNGQTVLTATPYELDIVSTTQDTIATMAEDKAKLMSLSTSNLLLLTEMFCLPYEHGDCGNKLLADFEWLLENVGDIYEQPPSKEKVSRWFDRLLRCDDRCKEVYDVFEKFCKIPNEAILYDLYPYVWDIKEVVLALDTYIHWLSDSITANLFVDSIMRSHSAMNSAFNRLPLMNDFIEPWHVKYLGGLTGALHRLLPFQGGYMYLGRAPDVPSNSILKMRTYNPSDKECLYNHCARNFNESISDNSEKDKKNIELIGDRELGMFTTICPKTLFLVEDNKQICGYIAAVPDNKYFSEQVTETWLPEMQMKYEHLTTTDETFDIPLAMTEERVVTSAAHIVLKMNSKINDECVVRRLLNSVLSVLKTSGACTVYHRLEKDKGLDLFLELGFFPVSEVDNKLMWRAL